MKRTVLTGLILTIALAWFRLAASQQTASGSIEGIVVRLGTNEPIPDAEVELTRLEGTTTAPLAAGAAQAFNALFDGGRGNPTNVVPPPALATEIQYVKVGSDGKFSFRNLKPGGYRLASSDTSGAYYPAEYGQRDPGGRGFLFPLAEGQAMRDAKLEMSPTSVIAGRVIDTDGEPVGHAQVFASSLAYENGRRILRIRQIVIADERGAYRLRWLPAGSYTVAARFDERVLSQNYVTPPGRSYGALLAGSPVTTRRILPDGQVLEESYGLAYYGGVSDPDAARIIDLGPGTTFGGADVSMTVARMPSHHIRGVLINGVTGQPAAGVPIRAIPLKPAPFVIIPIATTDMKGGFDLSGVVAGSYALLTANFRAVTTPAQNNQPEVAVPISGFAVAEMSGADIDGLRIVTQADRTLPGRVTIEGQVQNPGEADLTRIRVSLVREPEVFGMPPAASPLPAALARGALGIAPAAAPGSVSVDGSFALQLPQGRFRVTVTGTPQSTYVKSIRLGGTEVLADGLPSNISDSALEIVIATDAGAVRGSTITTTSGAMANAVVALVPDSPGLRRRLDLYKTATSDANGRFQLSDIAPGDYKLFAWEYAEPGAWQEPAFLQTYEMFGRLVRITEGKGQETQLTVIPARR